MKSALKEGMLLSPLALFLAAVLCFLDVFEIPDIYSGKSRIYRGAKVDKSPIFKYSIESKI